MKRTCKLLIGSDDKKRAIYIDEANAEEIKNYLTKDKRHADKFRFIAEIILSGQRNSRVYDKEDISKKSSDVTAMKFFVGQENDRIYCKEVKSQSGTFIVVAAILYEKKKTTKLSKQQRLIIEQVGGFEYEIQ